VPRHSRQPENKHASPTRSSLSTTENPSSTPAEFRESLSLFPISRMPQPRHTLRNRCIHRRGIGKGWSMSDKLFPHLTFNALVGR